MDLTAALAKETLIILFRSFPGHFVLIGGGALHWVFNSPRLSVDLDLKPLSPPKPALLRDMAEALSQKLPGAVPGGASITCRVEGAAHAVQVLVNGRPALRVELVWLAPVSGRETHLLQGPSLQSEIVVTPDVHQLLFAKAAALAKRPQAKGRDVFDIWFLQSRGARLEAGSFAQWLKWEEIEPEDLEEKLKQITPRRLESDLSRFLPASIRTSLARDKYQALIRAARQLWEPFL